LNYKTNILILPCPNLPKARAGILSPSERRSAGQALNYKTNIFLLGKDNCTKPKKNMLKKSS
jgi:hypothetical protein